MIESGKDGRFITTPGQAFQGITSLFGSNRGDLDTFTDSPVKTVFVTGSINLNNLTKQYYGPIQPIYSANKSIYATSSFGFCEIGLTETIIGLDFDISSLTTAVVVPVPRQIQILFPDF